MAKKDKNLTVILCCLGLFGLGGIHRFYKGKIISGIIWLLTGGLFLIGTVVDLILLITKSKMMFD